MALYVVQVPDPAPGQDWQTVVPGQYLYNVTGITATLTTVGSPPVMRDSSGNGNDGTYVPVATQSQFVAGALNGNRALRLAPTPFSQGDVGCSVPGTVISFTTSFGLVWWSKRFAPIVGPYEGFDAWDALGNFLANVAVTAGGQLQMFVNGSGSQWTSTGGVPADGQWHMVAFNYSAGTQHCDLWIDGVLQTQTITVDGPILGAPPAVTTFGMSSPNDPFDNGEVDEIAYVESTMDDADIIALFAAAPNFAAYTAIMLGAAPLAYYHLDDRDVPGAGRQVALEITDSTHRVLEIPTGFAEVLTPGPNLYSWQPRLNSAAETPDGHTITVPVPPLVLPAGYTIGTNSLDLSLTDQWSSIVVWWDSNIMDAQAGLSAYLFPPPVHLVYHQEPH